MEKYRSLYNKLKNEIEMLKKELSEEEKECFERQEKFKKTMLYKMNLEDELSDLKDKKEDDIKNNKKRISSIFDYIYSSFVTITFIAGVAISAYYMVENLSLLKPIITTIFAITLEVAITSIVEQILKKKTTL